MNIKRKKGVRKRRKDRFIMRVVKRMRPAYGIFLIIFVTAVTMMITIQSYRLLMTTSFFEIKNIDVKGIKRLQREDIIYLTGVSVGDNLLATVPHSVEYRVRRNPWIESATVDRKFPDKLIVVVREREPKAILNADGISYLIDSKGLIFKRFSWKDSIDLPVITGLSTEDISANAVSTSITTAFSLISLLSDGNDFGIDNLSEINFDNVYGITLCTLREGTRIYLGHRPFREKIGKIEKIVRSRGGDLYDIEYMDMTNPRGVTARLNHLKVIEKQGGGENSWQRMTIS